MVLAAAILVTVAVTIWTGGSTRLIESYRMADVDTIVVQVLVGELEWARVTDVQETDTEVRITVRVLSVPLLPQGDGGILRDISVDLKAPLDGRRVADSEGNYPPRASE